MYILMKTNKNGKSILLLLIMMMMINGHSKHGVHCDIIFAQTTYRCGRGVSRKRRPSTKPAHIPQDFWVVINGVTAQQNNRTSGWSRCSIQSSR